MSAQEFDPGWKPCGFRLIVWPVEIEEKTMGGIVMPSQYRDKEEMAQIEAVVLAIGPEAWADRPTARGDWCTIGDTVMIAQYAGKLKKGRDGKNYRVISDLDVIAVKEKE